MRALLFAAVLAILAGGAVWASASPDPFERVTPPSSDRKHSRRDTRGHGRHRRPSRPPLRIARCPASLSGCQAAHGRIVYVERVDPDGDGDLHVVITGGHVTAPGITAIDVERYLRPRRDPRIGDEASAAGKTYRGSYGQMQIQAVEVHFRRR